MRLRHRWYPKREKKPDIFDRKAAQESLEPENDKHFSEADRFLAQWAITRAEIDIHNARSARRDHKSACRNISLQEGASRYLMERLGTYGELNNLLGKVQSGDELSLDDRMDLKARIRSLYSDYLTQFSGVVCTTPVAASNFQFRQAFQPQIVLVDEGGRTSELELLVPIAWYDSRWIIVGDVQQLGPFLQTDPSAKNAVQSYNPFVKQIGYATLARATDASVTDTYLRFNHRAFGTLARDPSIIIYRDQMQIPQGKPQFPESVRAFNRFLQTIKPGLDINQLRLVVEFPGSWVHKIGIHWAIQQVVNVLKNKELKSIKGGDATILVLPYYQAQLQCYVETFEKLVGKDVTLDQSNRVWFVTLDSSQGAEADLCIVDLVQTDHPGFTGDERRQCLTLTRSRQCEIILTNRGTFTGFASGSRTSTSL